MEFTFPQDHFPPIVARLTVVCPRHQDVEIAHYVLRADGTENVESTAGFSSESVGPATNDEFLTNDALMAEDDVVHFRNRFQCLRPSCEYDAVVRCDGDAGIWALTTKMLTAMRAAGIAQTVVTNIDNTPWKVVSR